MTESLIRVLANNDLTNAFVTTKNEVISKDEFRQKGFFSRIIYQIINGRLSKDRVFANPLEKIIANKAQVIDDFVKDGVFKFNIGNEEVTEIELNQITANLIHIKNRINAKKDKGMTSADTATLSAVNGILLKITPKQDEISNLKASADSISNGACDKELASSKLESDNPFIKDQITARNDVIRSTNRKIENAKTYQDLFVLLNDETISSYFKDEVIPGKIEDALKRLSQGGYNLKTELDEFIRSDGFTKLPDQTKKLARETLRKLLTDVPNLTNKTFADLSAIVEFLNVNEYPKVVRNKAESLINSYISNTNSIEELKEIASIGSQFRQKAEHRLMTLIERSLLTSEQLKAIVSNMNYPNEIRDLAVEKEKRNLAFKTDLPSKSEPIGNLIGIEIPVSKSDAGVEEKKNSRAASPTITPPIARKILEGVKESVKSFSVKSLFHKKN
jgi:hypothetical protein